MQVACCRDCGYFWTLFASHIRYMYIFGLTSEHARVALVDNKANVLLEGFMSIFLRRGTVEN